LGNIIKDTVQIQAYNGYLYQ